MRAEASYGIASSTWLWNIRFGRASTGIKDSIITYAASDVYKRQIFDYNSWGMDCPED